MLDESFRSTLAERFETRPLRCAKADKKVVVPDLVPKYMDSHIRERSLSYGDCVESLSLLLKARRQ